MQVQKQRNSPFESNARQHWKKMPFLRSQTRGQVNNTSNEIKSQMYPKKVTSMSSLKSVTLSENLSSRSFESVSPPTSKISNTMFPFPPAPVLTGPSSSSSNANIINISNVSSESSAPSEASSVSIRSTSNSNPSSPLLEEHQSRSLNDAVVEFEDSLVDVSHSSTTVLQELTSGTEGKLRRPSSSSSSAIPIISSAAQVTQGICNGLPAILQQSMMFSTQSGSPYGPSIFIPVSEPSSVQEDRYKALLMLLQHYQCYDDNAGMELRERIIAELDTLVKQWTRSEGLHKNMPWTQVEQVGGKVVSYGSYKLGVVDKESDLDLLCVVPKHVTREDFFNNLYELLRKKDEVTELRKLPNAYVPVIKMKYRGIEIDLTVARIVCYDRIPNEEEFLLNPTITHDMNEHCLRSLNGYRATTELPQLVPCLENFRLTLRVVKLWAKKNGLYGNMLGFLGGASWSILVAKVCQMVGSEGNMISITNLILQFFCTYANWEWPKPVYIKRVENQPYTAWNPAMNHQDRDHSMPIITSSVPQMNSAYNVTKANCQLIKAKCAEALNTLQGIIGGSRSWSDLFQPSNFFEEYKDYAMISCSCLGDSSLWFGSVESKLRNLNNAICSLMKVQSARIWPLPFDKKQGNSMIQMWFIGIKMMVGQPVEVVGDPLYNFTDICMFNASNMNSHYASSFSVNWQILSRAQLGGHLTKAQISMGRVEKPSYAAVTMGGAPENTITSPMAMTSITMSGAGYINSGPILSPASQAQGDYRHMSHPPPPPYNRVFSAGHLNGFNGVVPPHHTNYIVYSTLGSQHGPMMPGPVLNTDQYHNGGVSGQKLTVVTRPPSHMLTFPPNRSLTSPQPGGYPSRPQSLENLLRPRGGPGPLKSPQTPAGGQMMSSGPSQQQRSSPGPGPGYINTNQAIVPASGTTYPHPIPNLTSYPPPPISPMSQFNSPPPPVPKITAPSQSSNLRQEERNPTVHLRVPIKRPKDLSLSEDTRLRSVSNSSDKFPPASLNRARVTHQDQLPVSPGVTGVVPLPVCVDTSVPPPSLPTPPPSQSPTPSVSFNMAKKKAFRTGRFPRISTSEVGDLNPPQMDRGCRASNNTIKLSLSSRRADDNVFNDNL